MTTAVADDSVVGTSARPIAPAVLVENIPVELRERPQWVGWTYEARKAKWTKAPLNVRTGRHASSTDLLTWATFDTALAYYRTGQCDGIGFVFCSADPFTGIDLDKCRDPETGVVAAWGQTIIDTMGGYAEVSPSLTGVKIWVRAKLPAAGRRVPHEGGEIEVYSQERFFTVTGHRLEGGAD